MLKLVKPSDFPPESESTPTVEDPNRFKPSVETDDWNFQHKEFFRDDIYFAGINDSTIKLFEGQFFVHSMSYNSYVIMDEKIAVFDTVDYSVCDFWMARLKRILGLREPDYLIVQHMEPDHSSSMEVFLKAYPNTKIVASQQAFTMMKQFYGIEKKADSIVVKEGDTLDLGKHKLTFVTAPMVHWPEVIVTYDSTAKVLFSADAFGKFGRIDADEYWTCEARRYYFGIVGKYGAQVQALLQKAKTLDIQAILPLHGPLLTKDLDTVLKKYDIWSSYEPEDQGVCVIYSSVYGHTGAVAEQLGMDLEMAGVEVVYHDLSRCDPAEAVEDAFRYSHLVLATTTYNGGIFPTMKTFIHALLERNFQKRTVALIENGTWAPNAAKVMKDMLSQCKDITFMDQGVRIKSALDEDSAAQVQALKAELLKLKKAK